MAQVREVHLPRFRRLILLAALSALTLAGCARRDPHLAVSTKEIDLGTDRSSGSFTVKNTSRDLLFTSGVTPLDYQIQTDVDWMTVTPSTGSCGEGESKTHVVEIDRSRLGDGQHTGLLLVTSNGGDATLRVLFVNGGTPSCTAPPAAPTGPSPALGATGVSTGADLGWSGGASQCPGLTATYDVRFGTSTLPPLAHDNGAAKSWDPGSLASGTTYYWQIVAKDANGSTAGPVWSFTTAVPTPSCTAAPSAPTPGAPADGTIAVAIDQDLSWSGGESQCAGLVASYDVRFGTSSPPLLVRDNGTAKSWDPGTLANGTTYFWQIVAHDANGSTAGPIWSFKTIDAAPPPPCTTPPSAACTPMPPNAKTGVNENSNLAWGCGDSACGLAVTYDVYFGTSPTPGAAQLLGNTISKSWSLPTLPKSTTFYWQVVTKDANGSTVGPVWSFRTRN